MKTSNFKKLNRQEQKEISGSGIIKKCSESLQCDPFQCCMGGVCLFSPTPECEPI
ncbi:hypothetical protein MP478_05050 [Chryseobacterium sp. WG14]|uniref:hypothetical protein n=1 Tax=Chryseobacterium sp. WG14 TaxID=2926909 RepID=UPI00211ED6AD|nr:hypothetical protein [Chryseobacterium sp. WG14]MCQ9638750.1 hypothetical protein [Chryseobacterium sp. WG14]